MSEQTTEPRSFLDRQRDAALADLHERQQEHSRVTDIVLGPNRHTTRRRVTEVIKLGDDYLVEITDRDDSVMWTFVVGGQRSSWVHRTQEEAILHLIAARHDGNPNSNHAAAFYAGRVLGIPAN